MLSSAMFPVPELVQRSLRPLSLSTLESTVNLFNQCFFAVRVSVD